MFNWHFVKRVSFLYVANTYRSQGRIARVTLEEPGTTVCSVHLNHTCCFHVLHLPLFHMLFPVQSDRTVMQSLGDYEYGQSDLIGHGAFALVFRGQHKKVRVPPGISFAVSGGLVVYTCWWVWFCVGLFARVCLL